MFAPRFFAPTYFAPRYFPPDGDGDTPPPFDPTNVGPGGTPLRRPEDLEREHKRILVDDERVLMAVIKKFLEMQSDA